MTPIEIAYVILIVLYVALLVGAIAIARIVLRDDKKLDPQTNGELHIILDKHGDDVMMLETNEFPRDLAKRKSVTFQVAVKRTK